MKNYELILLLSKLPAGLEVKAGGNMTNKELESGGLMDTTEDGEELYSYSGDVVDLDSDNSNIFLQLN